LPEPVQTLIGIVHHKEFGDVAVAGVEVDFPAIFNLDNPVPLVQFPPRKSAIES
jgi:hypothetical protein